MKLGPFSGTQQPVPKAGAERLRECRWEPCAEITHPEDWVSGVYLGKLTALEGDWQSHPAMCAPKSTPNPRGQMPRTCAQASRAIPKEAWPRGCVIADDSCRLTVPLLG